MYQAIATKQLMFPCSPKPKASLKARQIIVGLLQKNPTERLGSGVDDFQEIQAMPFFESLNWHNLLTKKIKPLINHLSSTSDGTSLLSSIVFFC